MSNGDPALVHDAAVDGPATHALVIGCGAYPHLPGGASPVQCPQPDGMGQLSSPPVSARRVADWFIGEYRDPNKPLATLALLLSEADPQPYPNPVTGVAHDVVAATADHVEAAVLAWRARADASPENRTVFYFCGHGTAQGTDTALLLADFCAAPANELQGALDFEKMYRAMNRAKAVEQVYFVDACRSSSDTLIEAAGFAGRIPLTPGKRDAALPKRLPATYYSTLAGDRAYALAGSPSVFTTALLKSFRGAASDESEDGSGTWRVDTALLKRSIDHFMRRPVDVGDHLPVQVAPAGELVTFELHVLDGPPRVPVYVQCDPPNDNERAEFHCKRGGNDVSSRPLGAIDPADPERDWELELDLGDYEFTASFPAGDSERTERRFIRPTFRIVKLGANP
jgi:hypothetical protein